MGYFLRQSSVNPKKDHAPMRKKKVRKTEDKKVYNISIARRREKSLNARCLGPFGDAKVGIKKAPRKWSANSLPILRNLCEYAARYSKILRLFSEPCFAKIAGRKCKFILKTIKHDGSLSIRRILI